MARTAVATAPQRETSTTVDHEVIVVGAGFGGIGAAVELLRAGVDDFVMIDKSPDVGGTWQANTYPGVAVDIPSVVYSFSYEPPKTWSRMFAPGAEVKAYADQLVDSYGLRPKLRLDTKIEEARWDSAEHLWAVTLEGGQRITARFLVSAVGGLEVPKRPDIDGIDSFGGKVMHTAQWDHSYDYSGKRVAVIGTGATALQLVPRLAETAAHLTVFQRTPIWVGPRPDFPIEWGLKQAFDYVPGLRKATRVGAFMAIDFAMATAGLYHKQMPFLIGSLNQAAKLWHRIQVPDAELRAKLTPEYTFLCKRPSVSNVYLKTFMEDHVDLVTESITKVTPHAVVTADGTEREIDMLVLATGFKVMEHGATPPFPVHGVHEELGEFWHHNRFQAYQGVSVPGFPNAFSIIGPYGFGGGSYIAMIECTAAHAGRAIKEARHRRATSVEVKQEPHDEYFAQCQRRMQNTVWFNSNCEIANTYYINYQGDAPALRPGLTVEMWWKNKRFDHDHYRYSALPG